MELASDYGFGFAGNNLEFSSSAPNKRFKSWIPKLWIEDFDDAAKIFPAEK